MEGTMISIRSIPIVTLSDAVLELEKIGFPPSRVEQMANETMWLHLKVEGMDRDLVQFLQKKVRVLPTRLMIQPTSADDSREDTLLLSGTPSQIEELASMVENESLELHEFSKGLRSTLSNVKKTRFTIPCRTTTLELGSRTLIMGAVNVTPDSFSDGGAFLQPEKAVGRALEMVEEGADVIDIGGESTRPGSKSVDAEEEMKRIIPVIKAVVAQTCVPVSVDTKKGRVAREGLDAGAQMINDISALRSDPKMAEIVASHDVPIVLMHMRGTPETMQQEIHYGSLIGEISQYLRESIDLASSAGVDPEKTIIDPGIGFGKTIDHNLAIIKHLSQFRFLGRPILIGTSRKSFIGKILNLDVDRREEGTMATLAASILNGAHILRVHNVRNAVQVARITDAIKGVSVPEA